VRRLFLISLAAALLPAIAYAAVSEHAAKHPPLPPAVQALAAHPGTRAHVIAGLKTLRETGVIAWARYEPAGKPAVAIAHEPSCAERRNASVDNRRSMLL